MLVSEVLWRIGLYCLNRTDGRGIEHLSALAMDELGKDAAFFHDNFAGSLTNVLGLAIAIAVGVSGGLGADQGFPGSVRAR
ncbi:MAG: hypothetical protein ABIQ18_29060 [Umezawaea sp.]